MTEALPDIPTRHELMAPHWKALDALNALLDGPERFVVWYTSRRAAKTSTIARAHLLTALTIPGANTIYTALTRGQAREVVWRTIWLPMLDKYEIDHKPNQTHQQSIFPNGSSVLFGGLDDEKHILTNLGTRLDLFTPDECQSAPSSLLKRLVEVVIAPAVSDKAKGKILLAGTIPEIEAGYFYEAITSGRWLTKNWSRWDNPFLEDQQKALDDFIALTGFAMDDPVIARDWFGRLVFDARATAFRYRPERSSYVPVRAAWADGLILTRADGSSIPGTFVATEPPPGINCFAIGTDPGTRDRWALTLWGWGETHPNVLEIASWVTPRNANCDWNDCGIVLDLLHLHYRDMMGLYRDAGSSQETLDLMGRTVGRMVLTAAAKVDLAAQVERLAALLAIGKAKVISGGLLEDDLKKARWNQSDREEGRYKWSSDHHPDVADSARYGLQGFFDVYVPPVIKTAEQLRHEELDAIIDKALAGAMEPEDVLSRVMGMNADGN